MVMLKLEEQPLLIQAIFNGELEDVRQLLAFKPDVNYQDAEKRSPLHAAAFKGDRDLAELLLVQGARVNTKDSSWLTPLHRACGVCADDTVELLLKHKADTTARDRQWQTPLHIAAAHNALGCIQHLLNHITNVNVTDRSGCTALHHAALNGHNEVVELLLSKGSIVNACDKKDCRPIHWAAHLGHVDTVSILIQKGADINVKDRNQYTPLHAAVASGMVYVCSLLLNAGADANAQNAFGNTPLHIACLNGHLSVCQILLAHDANLEAANYKGQTPLHIAAASTQGVGCLAYLLEQENIDINRQSADGRTPLHMSAIYGRFTRSKRLIDKGAVVDKADKNGNTALHIAAQYGHDILTATLLDFGADPVKRGYEGRTPLHACCLSGYVEVCRKFLQRPVDLNIVDDHGRTPIHCAAYKGSVECLDLLVSRGGDFKLQDSIGRTALHYAAVRGHYNCVYTLVGIGSKVNVLDSEGCSALHLAAAYDMEAKCVEYLIAHKADPLLKDIRGFTPIHYAVNGSNRLSLELLLKAIGKNINFLDVDMPETTPLHLAARHGELDILRSIIPYFPETNIKTKEGYTPLLVAAREGHTPNVQMLLRYGAKVAICDDVAGMSPVHHSAKNGHLHCLALLVDNSEVKSVIDRRDKYERTALMLAISGAHQDCALTLLKSNSDPNIVDADQHSSLFRAVVTDQNSVVQLLIACGSNLTAPDVNGKTVLHLAAACGHLKCLQKILQSVDEQDALVLDKNGFSALHWACYYGNTSCLDYLLQRNIYHKLDGNIFTPVHCAAFTGSERCLELLHTKFGVDCLRAKDSRNRTPLHLAAWHGHADCVRFLLDNGGDVEAKDEIGRSPLISAAQNGQSQVIDLLLAHKADLKAADANGCTALHVACLRKHNHTALLLLEYINDVEIINMVDNDKKTALHLSARNGLVEVTAELIKKGASVVATDNNGLTPALYCAPNACVAQCLAIILAHHPSEMRVGGLHTKECISVLKKLSRTSTRSSNLLIKSCQTEMSLLRNQHELFLVDVAKHRRKKRSPHELPPPKRESFNKSAKYTADKKLVLIENYDSEEFDVAPLKNQKGLSLHRSYSDMSLVAANTHENNRFTTANNDDDYNTEENKDGRHAHDTREATYQRLIDGYKTIALKMARVSSKYDVSVDDIQKAYVDQYAKHRKKKLSACGLPLPSVSCPILTPKKHELETVDETNIEGAQVDVEVTCTTETERTEDIIIADRSEEQENKGLPPYATIVFSPPPPSLCFASFNKVENDATTSTEETSTSSSDILLNGEFLYESYTIPDPPKPYCDCQFVCKNCVLLNRYDFDNLEAGDARGDAEKGLQCSHSQESVAEDYKDVDDDDQHEIIPLENLTVGDTKVFIGEGAIRKTLQGQRSEEKEVLIKDQCAGEKTNADEQIETLDITLEGLECPLNDFLDEDGDVDVNWPKVTFDEGRVKIPTDINENPTRDLDWSLFTDDIDLKASESLTNVACACAANDYVGLSCVTSSCTHIPCSASGTVDEFSVNDSLHVATSATELIPVVSEGCCTQQVRNDSETVRNNHNLKLHQSGLTLNEIPSSLLTTTTSTTSTEVSDTSPKHNPKLLRDSVAIVDFSALFPKQNAKKLKPCMSTDNLEQQEQEKELLKVICHAQDKIKRFSYQEMVDLSEGLNMSQEAKAMARRLIEQFANTQPQHLKINNESQEEDLALKLSDSGSDSGCESLNTSSLESVPSAPSLWEITQLKHDADEDDEHDEHKEVNDAKKALNSGKVHQSNSHESFLTDGKKQRHVNHVRTDAHAPYYMQMAANSAHNLTADEDGSFDGSDPEFY
ncbi:serine/threonine-protein phosphatase 6 regulatory ankyrin repeat subunit A-like isoform X2 [Atheta coriaria]|uniref:serine/threonine-protein phosphatase 6 regulatory ankyrin repeat subunit A-like isoform X2 n=1 Tax=Dalotia coriaria TaxID=877792 RepID=UPI0031F46D4F